MDPKKENAINALWKTILERAGIERDESEVGPPTHIPQGIVFAWFPSVDPNKPTVFQTNQPCPIKKEIEVFVMFHDANEARIYGLGDGGAYRWVLAKTAPTMYVEKLSQDAFIDAAATEVLLAEAEFDPLDDKSECAACGTENDNDAVFCKECGAVMQAPKVDPNGAADNVSPAV